MPKKIPLRQCVGCREMKPKRDLIRVVRSPEGQISLDFKGKASGRGAYVCPGFVDVHIHGYGGVDVSDDRPEDLRYMARRLPENGVTSFLPTSLTVAWDTLERLCGHIREAMAESRSPDFDGAEIAGMHMEGPFVNPARKGAQNEDYILPPEAERILPWKDVIRVITFAPEMSGGMDFIRTLKRETDIALSIGHTNATFEQAMAAIDAGVIRCTHIFNAMSPLTHRAPGTVGAALNTEIYTELIADAFHVHPGIFPMMARLKERRLVLITDALRAAGMPDGEYDNGGQTFVLQGIECRLKDGTIAGSVLKMNQAVRNLRDYGKIPLYEAVRAATLTAAESAGLEDRKGSLTPGKDADLVLLDADCNVLETVIRGVSRYRREAGR